MQRVAEVSETEDYWCSPESGKVKRWMEKEAAWSPSDPEWNARPDVTFVRELLAPRYADRRVLDLGAGTGRWVHLWTGSGCHLTSTDWSPPFFAELERRSALAGAACRRLDITEDSLPDTFDLVFASMFLMHVHPSRISTALSNIDRMATGRLCFTLWNGPDGFDSPETSRVQSFSHDYDALFEQIGWKTLLDLEIAFGGEKASGRNTLRLLEKSGC